jgi:hypothetical protein
MEVVDRVHDNPLEAWHLADGAKSSMMAQRLVVNRHE